MEAKLLNMICYQGVVHTAMLSLVHQIEAFIPYSANKLDTHCAKATID